MGNCVKLVNTAGASILVNPIATLQIQQHATSAKGSSETIRLSYIYFERLFAPTPQPDALLLAAVDEVQLSL